MTTAITTAGEELWPLFSQSQRPLNKEIVPVTTISLASGVSIFQGKAEEAAGSRKGAGGLPGGGGGGGSEIAKGFL